MLGFIAARGIGGNEGIALDRVVGGGRLADGSVCCMVAATTR